MCVARRDSMSRMNTDQCGAYNFSCNSTSASSAMVPETNFGPQGLSQSFVIPAKGSLIDNSLAQALKRARSGPLSSSLTMTKSTSGSMLHTAAKFTYRKSSSHPTVKIVGAGSGNSPSSSVADLSCVAAAVQADMCPYTFIETVLVVENDQPAEKVMQPLHEAEFLPLSEEEIAAYSNDAIVAVRANDIATLRQIHAQGRSLRQCNRFGESLLHVACRRSSAEVVSFLLHEAGVLPRIKDDYGRTPLHDACWRGTPAYDVVELLLQAEPRLAFVQDVRGHKPFQYARREHWGGWREFLDRRKDLLLS